jgi:hypothetical protein
VNNQKEVKWMEEHYFKYGRVVCKKKGKKWNCFLSGTRMINHKIPHEKNFGNVDLIEFNDARVLVQSSTKIYADYDGTEQRACIVEGGWDNGNYGTKKKGLICGQSVRNR